MTNPNDPAFPQIETTPERLNDEPDSQLFFNVTGTGGLTKRELFVMVAMHKLCGHLLLPGASCDGLTRERQLALVTRDAVAWADAQLVELSKNDKPES